ncbi:hypothetical protein KUTeg_000583 [Tegillarca granosa]|uniref:Protein kinase domain-containing protein n=1 Tax=Tegillarca granosa TaxID=220873 RepID=A0ABQ9FZ00_TEGGR|nr:hypothetical protein KUTeg_000583 [Tegillarca granosa]
MSGVPLLNSQQSDFSFDANQNRQSDSTISEGSRNSSNDPNIQNDQHVLDISRTADTMGNNFNRPSSGISVSLQNNVTTEIKLHGYDSYQATADDMNLPVQELIKKILSSPESQFKEIGPSALQLFGIASIDKKRQCKCIWKNPKVSLACSKSSHDTSSSSLYLRIRFIPSKSRVERLRNLGKEIIHYLYHQCKEDFIQEQFTYLYGKEISSAKARGLAVVDVAITSKMQNIASQKVLKNDLKNFLPTKERVKYWRQYKLKENMKPLVLKFEQQQLELEVLMVSYISDVLQEVMEYTIEEYEAFYKTMDMREKKKEITFDSEDIAISFVSGIDGYYRLINDYYFSPCHQVEPPSLEELKQDLSTENFYILTQSVQHFNEYYLHFTQNGQVHKRILMLKPGKKFCIKDNEEQVFDDIQSLMKFLSLENPLLPTKIPRRIGRPNIDVGDFTEVHNAVLNDETVVAVKVLRHPFQKSIMKHISFMGPHFLNIQGICPTTPPKVIMDYSPLGSLSTFFVRRRPDQPLYLHHLMFAATQVAEGLLYLAEHDRVEFNEIYHGNICCKNILVLRYEFNSIMVKIGDPGMITLYNQLPVTDAINKKSLKTDIYAFGTTMWEMFAQGSNPLDYPPLLGKRTDEVQRFFTSGEVLPRPPGLEEKSSDVEQIKNCKTHLHNVMLSCWKLDVFDRKSPKEVVRDLNSLSTTYGESYHLYDEIPDELLSKSASNNTSDHDSNEVPDILTNLIEREASESCDFEQTVPKLLPEPPRPVMTPANVGLKRQSSLPSSEKPLIFSKNSAVNKNLDLKKLNLPQAPTIPGMDYIYQSSNKRIIHCDLAGRNILLDKNCVAKISDFGLAKALAQDKDYYTRSMKKERFTTKSDVWSYGIVVWEAVTHGKSPYSDWGERLDFGRFKKGDRLAQPEKCPDDVYDLMKQCWHYEAEQRPGAASSSAATVNRNQITNTQQTQAQNHRNSQSLKVVPSSSGVTLVVGHVSAVNSHSPFSPKTSSVVNTPVSSHLNTHQGQLVGKMPTPTVSLHGNSTASPSNISVTSPSASPVGTISKPVTSPVVTPSGDMTPPVFPPIGSPSSVTSPLSLSFEMKGRQLPLPPHDDIKFLINTKELKTETQKVLGIGYYGTVFEGTYKGRKVAIKILKSEFQDKLCDEFIEEIDIIGKLKHKNIIVQW